MIEITTETSAIQASLRELQQRMGNLRPLMREIGGLLENKVRDRRETFTDPDGKRWADWSDGYAASYDYKRPGEGSLRRKILERTGDMWEGFSWAETDSSVRVGFDQPYSAYHEAGTDTMPRRGLLYADPDTGRLSRDDESALVELVESWRADTLT